MLVTSLVGRELCVTEKTDFFVKPFHKDPELMVVFHSTENPQFSSEEEFKVGDLVYVSANDPEIPGLFWLCRVERDFQP